MSTYDYAQIIEEGKTLMKGSSDAFHAYSHAESVERTALAVYDELRTKNYPGIDSVSPELVSIVSWWHDCYKSRLSEFTVVSNFNEGKRSGKIIRETLTGRMKEDDLETLVDAVEGHAGARLAPYFFLNIARSPLHKILLEADAHDLCNIGRLEKGVEDIDSFGRLLWIIIDILLVLILPFYLRTDTTRKDLYSDMWKFWGAWLWDEKYFLKAIRGLLAR